MNRPYWVGLPCVLAFILGAASPTLASGAQAATASAPRERDAACTACHNEAAPTLLVYQSRHGNVADARTPGCVDCHGPSAAHLRDQNTPVDVVFAPKSKVVSPSEVRNAACLKCHDTKTTPRTLWKGSQHETRGVACNDCHNAHAADQRVISKATQADVCYTCHKAQRAQTRRISTHPLAITAIGSQPRMTCSDCHNPHGSTGPSMVQKNTINETCFTCHAEKRGPFLWEHAPVVENCITCHTPHGSTQPTLLKTRVPWLCQECHTGDHAAQVNSGANLAGGGVTTINGTQQPGAASPRAQMAARGCLNCHVLVHGSNHPAGAKFQR